MKPDGAPLWRALEQLSSIDARQLQVCTKHWGRLIVDAREHVLVGLVPLSESGEGTRYATDSAHTRGCPPSC
jgi:hypothetical protein